MVREKLSRLQKVQIVRTILFVTGLLLMISSPFVGVIPGPGGVVVFAAGLALALKYSEWAKCQYVRFKKAHPRKGSWADWGLRRRSAARREARRKELEAAAEPIAGAPLAQPEVRPGLCDD